MLTVVERSRQIFFSRFLYTLLFYVEQMIHTMNDMDSWETGRESRVLSHLRGRAVGGLGVEGHPIP